MNTNVPLRALLHRFNEYGHEQRQIRNELIKSVFGDTLKAGTPYEKILTHHPFDSAVKISREQQMCDKLNEHLKYSKHLPIVGKRVALGQLTLETSVDLKPFALLIGCCLLFIRFIR